MFQMWAFPYRQPLLISPLWRKFIAERENQPMSDTRIVSAIAEGEGAVAARAALTQIRDGLGDAQPALLVLFASTKQPLGETCGVFREAYPAAALLASSSSGEFTEKGDREGSVAAFAVAGEFVVRTGFGTNLAEDPSAAVESATAGLAGPIGGFPHRTGILLLDPLAGNGEQTTLLVASMLGPEIALAGGAAGDDLNMAETHVAAGDHAGTNAMALGVVHSKRPLAIGIAHGHEPLSAPMTVTKADGGQLIEVDGRPAWEAWREATRDAAKATGVDVDALADEAVGGHLLRYEAGLASGETYKIRAPLSKDDAGALSMACAVPQGAEIRVMQSDPASQIASAKRAAESAAANLGVPAAGALVFDCICRNLILEDQFATAVHHMHEALGKVPLAGFETYGEIALAAGDWSGFHNTTTVVLAFA